VSFCTLAGFMEVSVKSLFRMAGTTRLELATSAVTGHVKYSQQLTTLLGTAKYLIIPSSRAHLGLAFGLKKRGSQ
jgi:hypothetical protein